jgi:hypothetical protein
LKQFDSNESFCTLKCEGYEINRFFVEKLGLPVRFTASRLKPASSPGVGIIFSGGVDAVEPFVVNKLVIKPHHNISKTDTMARETAS